eukprot:COSAG05_NODE_2721_length_2727_cov_76.050228_1_plen_275_part_00
MSISAYFERQIEMERLREQQASGGGGGGAATRGPPLYGRRSAEGRSRGDEWEPAPAPAPTGEWGRPDGEDEQVLLQFYSDFEPEFANLLKVQKIMKTFQRKAAKTGADWREWMYSDLKSKRGVDPREHVAGGGAAPQPPGPAASPGLDGGDAGYDPRALLRSRDRQPARRQQPAARAAAHPQQGAMEPHRMVAHPQHAGDWDQQLRQHKLTEGSVGGGPGKYHAARSHELHAEYGGRWDTAYLAPLPPYPPLPNRVNTAVPDLTGVSRMHSDNF